MENNHAFSKDLIGALAIHAQLYPEMEAQDLVKLIYQFTLGPNHLLGKNLSKVKEAILLEGRSSHSSIREIIYIGNDLYRVALVNDEAYLDNVFQAFIKTADDFKGKNKEAELRNNIEAGAKHLSLFKGIGKEDYLKFISGYYEEGMAPVSHSAKYKETYRPSYRLIHKRYLDLL